MAGFSVETALRAPFRVIRRKPLALVAWGLVYLVFGFAPSTIVSARLEPVFLAQSLHPGGGDPQAFLDALAPIAVWLPLIWFSAFATTAVIYGAVFRAVLTPDDDKFLYLRISTREMWLALTTLGLVVVIGLGLAVLGSVLSLVAASASPVASLAAAVAALIGLIWLATRFSLSTVIAFAEKRFVFIDSWPLTRGHALTLFGVALAILVMLMIGEIALAIPLALGFDLNGAYERIAKDPAYILQNTPMIVVGAILIGLFGAVTHAILGAPWASIYQQLTEKPQRRRLSPGEAVPLDD
ncbi:MAG: hypothetical protein JSR98_20810 [Proteobacteria bacterium]|nr:hypothetical protein [Pseudomonadota bacterium]